jgi:hypothetical protein
MITQTQFPFGNPVLDNPKSNFLGLTLLIVVLVIGGGTILYLNLSKDNNENK